MRRSRARRARRVRNYGPDERWGRRLVARARATLSTPRRAIFLIVFAAVCFTAAPTLRYCSRHAYFTLRDVEIYGAKRLDPATVRWWLGMAEGSSIWEASPRALEAVLLTNPAIARARVQRLWPDRLRVTVRERRPRAVLRAGDQFYALDTSGIAFALDHRALEPADLPIVSVQGGIQAAWDTHGGVPPHPSAAPIDSQTGGDGDARAGSLGLPPTKWLRQAVRVARRFEAGVAGIGVSEIALGPGPELIGYSNDGKLTVRLGWGAWRAKLRALHRVVQQVASEPGRRAELAGTIDVRDPAVVVLRRAGRERIA